MLSDPRKVDDSEVVVETAHGPRPLHEVAERAARPELHAAADEVAASVRTVEFTVAEMLAVDDLIMHGAGIMLRTHGYAFPRELANAHRKLQAVASSLD